METKKKPLIHNVVILDSSGSMSGSKYNNALKGLNEEMEDLRKDENADYTMTVIEFSTDKKEHCFMAPLSNVELINGRGANGGTALYQTVGEALERVALNIGKGEHVLVKIFTDGEENSSTGRFADAREVQKLINILEKANFTVTFEGTQFDAEKAIERLGIKKGNTLVHDNTGDGIYANAKMRGVKSMEFSASVASGNATMDSFYSDEK
jgi:hypothetical protein